MTDIKTLNNKTLFSWYLKFQVIASEHAVPCRKVVDNKSVCLQPVFAYLYNENENTSSLTSLQETPPSTVPLCYTKDRVLQYPACQASEPEGFYKGDNPSVSQSFPIYVYLEENVFSNKADVSVLFVSFCHCMCLFRKQIQILFRPVMEGGTNQNTCVRFVTTLHTETAG